MIVANLNSRFTIKRNGVYDYNIIVGDTPFYFRVSAFSKKEDGETNYYWLVRFFDVTISDEPIRIRKRKMDVKPNKEEDVYIEVFKNEIRISDPNYSDFWVEIVYFGGIISFAFIEQKEESYNERQSFSSFLYSELESFKW